MTTAPDDIDFPEMHGRSVTAVTLHTLVMVEFGREADHVLFAANDIFVSAAGVTTRVRYGLGGACENLDVLARLIGQTVESAVMRSDGSLAISFIGGEIVSVPPRERYESWSLRLGETYAVSPIQ